ncbi:MAG: hypothetical protein K8S20_10735 [Chloroflexi bacterium]|nr:hypothetical protein [Chloroflexota bacterium]
MDILVRISIFLVGLVMVVMTIFSALSTFVLTRAARSQLNRVIFGVMRRVFDFILRFTRTYEQRDAIMAYYSPLSLIMLIPTWYALILAGYGAMYWSLGVGEWFADIRYSGSSLLTLGFATSENPFVTVLSFSEALLGLLLVALLMAYLPTMYAAFSRREQAVSLLEVRAGNPPSALEMLLRFNRIHGLEKLSDYWKTWEIWFADIEESHTTLPALVFFRSPRSDSSWVTAAGAILDSAALTLAAVNIPSDPSAALNIRAGYLALRRIADYFDISSPQNPSYPADPISVKREEFDELLRKLQQAGVPVKSDREKAWLDYAGWRVNYDRVLLVLCTLVMAPEAPWSSDRAPKFKNPPIFFKKKKHH